MPGVQRWSRYPAEAPTRWSRVSRHVGLLSLPEPSHASMTKPMTACALCWKVCRCQLGAREDQPCRRAQRSVGPCPSSTAGMIGIRQSAEPRRPRLFEWEQVHDFWQDMLFSPVDLGMMGFYKSDAEIRNDLVNSGHKGGIGTVWSHGRTICRQVSRPMPATGCHLAKGIAGGRTGTRLAAGRDRSCQQPTPMDPSLTFPMRRAGPLALLLA